MYQYVCEINKEDWFIKNECVEHFGNVIFMPFRDADDILIDTSNMSYDNT